MSVIDVIAALEASDAASESRASNTILEQILTKLTTIEGQVFMMAEVVDETRNLVDDVKDRIFETTANESSGFSDEYYPDLGEDE
jgi:hypothetical protein